ncbi:hypothetical protein [Streptomyces carpinensis]|uniref:Uncharacterized protein n=1 Tax=Streptomyces carpinensis TaxID=66369 RepID=A0ABV1VYJ7_9ACTN|nr:hypothetical protein [Streptomyces carpinensis]
MVGVGPRPKKLVSSSAEKRAEHHIEPGTRRAGDWADEETGIAVRAFGPRDGEGRLTSSAPQKAHRTWTDQVGNLMDRLGADKEALRSGDRVLTGMDLAVGSALRVEYAYSWAPWATAIS